jgi:hypothetical protein
VFAMIPRSVGVGGELHLGLSPPVTLDFSSRRLSDYQIDAAVKTSHILIPCCPSLVNRSFRSPKLAGLVGLSLAETLVSLLAVALSIKCFCNRSSFTLCERHVVDRVYKFSPLLCLISGSSCPNRTSSSDAPGTSQITSVYRNVQRSRYGIYPDAQVSPGALHLSYKNQRASSEADDSTFRGKPNRDVPRPRVEAG